MLQGVQVTGTMPVVDRSWVNVKKLPIVSEGMLKVYLAVLEDSAVPYTSVDYTQPCMIVIGSEAVGIGPEARELLNAQKIYIPMSRRLESFNAAVAGTDCGLCDNFYFFMYYAFYCSSVLFCTPLFCSVIFQ